LPLQAEEIAMSQANQDQVVDILSNGLVNFANATGDREIVKFGAVVLRNVQDVFVENIKAGETCTFAFPSMVVLPDIRVECFVAVLNDRMVVAWRKGVFRKTTVSRVIPKGTIKQASWAISNRPGTSGAALLTIIADETINIAMPKGKPAVADAVVAAVQAQ
jgi:hypothetical protein